MTYGSYELEYLDPDQPEPEPATVHPDPAEAAWLYSQCRDFSTRRFALAGRHGPGNSCITWHGLQFTNGRAAIWSPTGYLVGNYASVHTARRQLAKDKLDLYLVWLEPEPPVIGPKSAAEGKSAMERRSNPPQHWSMTVGFTAFGPDSARLVALDVSLALDGMLPGFARRDVAIVPEDDPGVTAPVFCARHEDCVKIPAHKPPCVDAAGDKLKTRAGGDAS